MNLSTKGRYAIRAMLDLALQSGEGYTLLKGISKRQEISHPYLEQLFTRLKTARLVRTARGPNGGFMLARSPSEITIREILQTMEGSTAPVECVDDVTVCSRAHSCVCRKVWVEMKEAIDKVLEATSLQDLAKRQKQDEVEIYEA